MVQIFFLVVGGIILFHILVGFSKLVTTIIGWAVGSASGISEEEAKSSVRWGLFLSVLFWIGVPLIFEKEFFRIFYSYEITGLSVLQISYCLLPPVLFTTIIAIRYRIRRFKEEAKKKRDILSVEKKAKDLAREKISEAEKVIESEVINYHKVDKIEYENESLNSLLSYSNLSLVEYGGTLKIISTNNGQVIKKNFFKEKDVIDYLVKKLNKEWEIHQENSETPTQRLIRIIRSRKDFLRERGYTYKYTDHLIDIINMKCGSSLEITYGQELISKENSCIYILGKFRSFDDFNLIGEGFCIRGLFEERSADDIDKYVYYFGESVEDTISFLDRGSKCGGYFYPSGRDWHNRALSPWQDRHGRFQCYREQGFYEPDRSPL